MNEPKKTDFFPAAGEKLKALTYRETEEDISHEENLRELGSKIYGNSGAAIEDDLGELPFDEEADRTRWSELEKDFDRVFDEAERLSL